MAIKVNIQKYPTAFPSKTICTNGGAHIYSLSHDEECWNGAVVAKGAYESLDVYKEAEATTMDAEVIAVAANGNFYVEIKKDIPAAEALIVYNVPMIEEEYNKSFLLESNYYIPADTLMRSYAVREGDVWELSKENFQGEVAVGKKITSITGKKWTIAG